jgi:putative heme-binding domain-containing protein
MDFPIFHLDGMGNRMLIAIVGILHVTINHALAVGAMPLITLMAWHGRRSGLIEWDRFAHRMLKACFIITTTVGALTGVGIWFSVSLVNPAAIASLIRVFFWAWFTEWLVFVTEVCLILAFYMTWPKNPLTEGRKNLVVGVALSVFSWITMALIVAILGFMMDPGAWEVGMPLLTAIFNPIYLPQLAFRTTLAMVEAGLFAWLFASFTTEPGEFRSSVIRFAAKWITVWALPLLAGALWYGSVVPQAMAENVGVAIGTQRFADWAPGLLILTGICTAVIFAAGIVGIVRPEKLPRLALAVPFLLSLVLMGEFERVREFIRKPYVIADYMYANGLREKDVPLYQRDGLLTYATYCSTREIFPQNRLEAGRDVFRLACSRCHTTQGMNGVTTKFTTLLGEKAWDAEKMAAYIRNIHGARPFMPPFPGNEAEASALAEFIISHRKGGDRLSGDQSAGVQVPRSYEPFERTLLWCRALQDEGSAVGDRQQALAALSKLGDEGANAEVTTWLTTLERKTAPRELELDILDAAKGSRDGKLKSRASRLEQQLDADKSVERHRLSLAGGNALRGAELFQTKTCVACHKVDGVGAEVGPDLSKIAEKRDRAYLLESVVAPAAKIAEGYEAVTILRDDGTEVGGILKSRTAKEVVLKTPAGQELRIPVAEIDEEARGKTLMPLDIVKTLSRAELRDLVEYLSQRRS